VKFSPNNPDHHIILNKRFWSLIRLPQLISSNTITRKL
jgi:hypothetical protein